MWFRRPALQGAKGNTEVRLGRKVKNRQARPGHQRGMGGRWTDDDDTIERHTDTSRLRAQLQNRALSWVVSCWVGLLSYCLNSRSEENFIRNTSIFGAWNTAYSMEYVEYGWNTGGIQASGRSFGIRGKRIQTVGPYRVGVQSEPGCSSPFYLPTYLACVL